MIRSPPRQILHVREYSAAKQTTSLAVLVVLGLLSCLRPVFFQETLGSDWWLSIPVFFWIFLSYGLLTPFLTRWVRNPSAVVLWGTTVFTFYWSYFTIVEPGLRYPDSFVHSRSALLVAAEGINPERDRYLLWPVSFILQSLLSNVSGLTIMASSRVLAIILTALVGLAFIHLFSLFLELKHAILALCISLIMPNTLIANTRHYSPQLFAYLMALLAMSCAYGRAGKSRGLHVVLTLMLFAIVLSSPTTTLWITPVLVTIGLLSKMVERRQRFLATGITLALFLGGAAAWWLQPAGTDVIRLLSRPPLESLHEALTLGRYRLTEGLYRPSYQPLYSLVIRRATFLFLAIITTPALFELSGNLLRFLGGKTSRLGKVDVFFTAVIASSVMGTLIFWASTSGGFGDRTSGILAPVLAILSLRGLQLISRRKRLGRVAVMLTAGALLLVPLNFVATNYSEVVNQTTLAETAAITFVSLQGFHDQVVFSDSLNNLNRFLYAMPDASNVFLYETTAELNASLVANISELCRPPWTLFIHGEDSRLIAYFRYGIAINPPAEPAEVGITKFLDDGSIRLYQRPGRLGT